VCFDWKISAICRLFNESLRVLLIFLYIFLFIYRNMVCFVNIYVG